MCLCVYCVFLYPYHMFYALNVYHDLDICLPTKVLVCLLCVFNAIGALLMFNLIYIIFMFIMALPLPPPASLCVACLVKVGHALTVLPLALTVLLLGLGTDLTL